MEKETDENNIEDITENKKEMKKTEKEKKKEMKASKKEEKKAMKASKKESKHKIPKGQIAVKIVAGFAAFIMLLSVFSTGIYYICSYIFE